MPFEVTEGGSLLHIDPEMELLMAGAFDLQQDNIGDEVKKTGADAIGKVGLFPLLKTIVDAALSTVSLAKSVHPLGARFEEIRFYKVGVMAEDLPEDCIVDKGFYIALWVEPDISFLELAAADRDGGIEMSQDAFDDVHRDAPDAEEAQDMVDAE